VPISLLIGTCLGIAHGRLAQLLASGEIGAAQRLHLDGSQVLHADGPPLPR
jgi:hypothetical protein